MTEHNKKDLCEQKPPVKEQENETTAPVDPAADAPAKDAKADKKKDKAELISLREEVHALTAHLTAAEAELADQKDKYLRMAAEYDNFRRRSQKEREALYTDAAFDVLADILPVIDNLERAAEADGETADIKKGLEMTLSSVRELLKKQGVEPFGEAGETFDPALHHAVMHEEDPEKGEGEITRVFMRGYRKGDRVLRYAMVTVVN